jgi:hypothetical protein
MIERIADLVREKKLEGISGVADESDRVGVRVVIELKRDATPEVVLNQLFRFTQMQTSFRLQHAGAERRAARAADAARLPDRLPRLPRGGRRAAHGVRAEQGARPGACAMRPRRGGVERRRGRAHHPPAPPTRPRRAKS